MIRLETDTQYFANLPFKEAREAEERMLSHAQSLPHSWVQLPFDYSEEMKQRLSELRCLLSHRCDYIVCIGIGGSYMGTRAIYEALKPTFSPIKGFPQLLFAGYHLEEQYLVELQHFLADKRFGIIYTSKSGETLEPAIAFRFLHAQLVSQIGVQNARDLTIAITDPTEGYLRQFAEYEDITTFAIPTTVGGRYSVLSAVGLVPLAVAGIDVDALIAGAKQQAETLMARDAGINKPSIQYVAARYALYKRGYKIELLVSFEPRLCILAEWWKQLFGETEGKENKGIFPASAQFTTDLHSLGQWIQEGERVIFESFLTVSDRPSLLDLEKVDRDPYHLNWLDGHTVESVNRAALHATRAAHLAGGVPNLQLTIDRLDASSLGELIYFFQTAAATGGFLLGIDPYNQPGVEAYKQNMYTLLKYPNSPEKP